MNWTRNTVGSMATGTYTSECGRWHIDNCHRGRRNWGLWYRADPATPIARARKAGDYLTLTHAKDDAAECVRLHLTNPREIVATRNRIRETEKEANADTTPCGYCGSTQGYTYHGGHSERSCIECHGC